MPYQKRKRLAADAYAAGILAGDRVMLSRAITLVESRLPEDNDLAEEVMEQILPKAGKSLRIGITGVPGVGKSTFIEAFGTYLTEQSHKLAVLAIDPSSQRSKGSILGDKTRMEKLSNSPHAFIRPSATGTALGGVAGKTREVMLLCEAAGYDVIIVETVGVGQSETAVHGMVDFFLLLMLAGAGDELQGIKKGIMEMADAVAITKADGENKPAANRAKRDYLNALHLFPPPETGWFPKVLTTSALKNEGLKEIWETIEEHTKHMKERGYFEKKRNEQKLHWLEEAISYLLQYGFYSHEKIKEHLPGLRHQVLEGKATALQAARRLMHTYTHANHR